MQNTLKSIDPQSLIGQTFQLTGVDLVNRTVKLFSFNSAEQSEVINFILDGKTYTAIEDASDGYRSSMHDFYVSDGPVNHVFEAVKVLCQHGREADIIEFVDLVNGKVVLEIGTDYSDNYYPSFVANWNPGNLSINEPPEVQAERKELEANMFLYNQIFGETTKLIQ